jgi:hypothetical protein
LTHKKKLKKLKVARGGREVYQRSLYARVGQLGPITLVHILVQ